MNITIIGSGHGGSATAATLAKKGYNVSILKLSKGTNDTHYEELEETGYIMLEGIKGKGLCYLDCVSRDPSEVIPNADVIFVFYVSNYHQKVAKMIAPYLNSKQIIYICPGYAGSILFRNELDKINPSIKPLFIEGETLPFSCRITAPGKVKIHSENMGHPIASFPADRIEEGMQILEPLIGKCVERNDILEVALHNPNLIMHTIGIAMNASFIENSNGEFAMYTQGFSPSIWKIVDKLDAEKMAVLERIGAKRRSYIDEFRVRTFIDPDQFTNEAAFEYYANDVDGLKTTTVNNRYLTEDVPMGLGLLHSLGKHLNIKTPVTDSIITLSGIMLDTDYFEEARTIESLGYHNIADLLADTQRLAHAF